MDGRGDGTGTLSASSGKFYFEVLVDTVGSSGQIYLGVQDAAYAGAERSWSTAQIASMRDTNALYGDGKTGSGASYGAGDLMSFAFDADSNKLYIAKNGVYMNGGNPSQGTGFTHSGINFAGGYTPIVSDGQTGQKFRANFGQKPFKFPPPDGFQPLNGTTVLPEIVISRPDQYVGVTTYSGSTGTGTIKDENIEFTPDFVWVKDRGGTEVHALYDTVRGSTGGNFYRLSSNNTNGNNSPTNELTSMIRGGFTANNNGHIYYNGKYYVSWMWKEAGGNKNTFNVDDVGYASASDINMSASSLNSATYNTSNRWSDDYAGAAVSGGYAITKAFDGDRTTAARVEATQTAMSVDLTNITVIDKIEVRGEMVYITPYVSVTVGGTTYQIGGDPDTLISGSAGTTSRTITGVSGALTNVKVGRVNSGRTFLSQIIVDGKILVDDNITPPNAPSIAATGASVGTKQGFSIIKYDGNGTAGSSIPHGLLQSPEFVMVNSPTHDTDNWQIYNDKSTKFIKIIQSIRRC